MEGKNAPLEIIPTQLLKRLFDIVASAIVIVLLSPIILLLLLLALLEQALSPTARGPLFYKETRISQGKPFTFYKIRTFKMLALEKAHENGIIHTKKLEHDFRNLTFIGMVLIQVYLDEFPQLFLVLIGKMSFVGPRPTNPQTYAEYIARGNRAKAILKAGLTGRFQTHKAVKYGLDQEHVDMEYAYFCKNSSGLQIVQRDITILLQTAYTIIRAEGI
jgi:lipopolysaccharide/colanic/teichoic acid biosynthesis glycosyltransferase